MKCPVCNVELKMMDRQGVEIDYCPQCRGVWLDRGELDKIIERSTAYQGSYGERDEHTYRRDDDDDHRPYSSQPPQKKKRSFLGEMFDIFD